MADVGFLIHYTFPKALNMYDRLALCMTPFVMTNFYWQREAFNFLVNIGNRFRECVDS